MKETGIESKVAEVEIEVAGGVQGELKPVEVGNQAEVKIVGQSLHHQFRTGRLYGLLGVLHDLSPNTRCCALTKILISGSVAQE